MVEIVQKNVNAQFVPTNMQRWTQLNSNETTELSLDQQIKCSIKHLLFQMWIEIQINIRYVHLTSPQPCYVGVDVIGWLLSCFSLSLFSSNSRSLSLFGLAVCRLQSFLCFIHQHFNKNDDCSSLYLSFSLPTLQRNAHWNQNTHLSFGKRWKRKMQSNPTTATTVCNINPNIDLMKQIFKYQMNN